MKFLLLDAHGVLLRVKGSVGAIYSNTAHRHGIRLSEAHVNTHFGDAFRRAPQFSAPYRTSLPTNTLIALNRSHSSRKSYNSSNASKRIEYPTSQHRASSFAASMTTPTIPLMESLQHSLHSVDKSNDMHVEKLMRWEKAWWRRIVEYVCQRSHVDVDSRNFDAFFENVYEEFSQQQTWEIFEDVRPLLERAQTKGIPVGVVSNFDTRLVGLLHDFGLLPYISSVTLSTWCGFAKPDQRIFQQALHDLQVDVRIARNTPLRSFLLIYSQILHAFSHASAHIQLFFSSKNWKKVTKSAGIHHFRFL
eukprot:TRINITY_DN1430_c0_g1_i4.p1 TRINITY_DN1430_c0_g1~~TRINITY_DN1430_c0_g1_i4.p1  ORF type:complete len:305 (+),score=56.44 TRINITY_DN1430_c0_g1_i4:65-979(+)